MKRNPPLSNNEALSLNPHYEDRTPSLPLYVSFIPVVLIIIHFFSKYFVRTLAGTSLF